MIETITPVRFHSPVDSGRTRPSRIECEKPDGSNVEVIAKFSEGCTLKDSALAKEVIAASLAADIGLPVPPPYLLDVIPEFIETIPSDEHRNQIASSNPIAFGSTEVGNGFRIWSSADRLNPEMIQVAAGIFCFDAFVVNDDRRTVNPNLLVRGSDMRVIDHESSWAHKMLKMLMGWQPPWEMGSLAALTTPGNHIFYEGLKGKEVNFSPIEAAWAGISDGRLQQYRDTVPDQWTVGADVDDAISLIAGVRDNISGSLAEVRRVLS